MERRDGPHGGAPAAGERRREWLGAALVLIGAVAYAVLLVLARLAYEEGTEPITVLFVRAGGFCLMLGLFLAATRRPMALPPTRRYASLGLGTFLAFQTFCNYSAITYIPVSLAILLLYTYPLWTALGMRVIERERLPTAAVLCLIAAFAGLGLALRVAGEAPDPTGIALGLAAGLGLATAVIVSNRILKQADSRRLTLHMTFAAATTFLIWATLRGGFDWPDTALGWAYLAVMPGLYLVAMLCFFTAVPMIGPTRTAMLNNLEPVTTIALAAVLLGETLASAQYLGAALVIGGIVGMQVANQRAKLKP